MCRKRDEEEEEKMVLVSAERAMPPRGEEGGEHKGRG